MEIERKEMILGIVDKLGAVSVKQLHQILISNNIQCSYRHTCRMVEQLNNYLTFERRKQKIIYLNKVGRNFINSDRVIKRTSHFEHMLLANDVFIYFGCPATWKTEYVITVSKNQNTSSFIKIDIGGLKIKNQERIICDAFFQKNGYTYLIEIDNVQRSTGNQKKINQYLDSWSEINKQYQNPVLCIFTKSPKRKKTFQEQLRNVRNKVLLFDEL